MSKQWNGIDLLTWFGDLTFHPVIPAYSETWMLSWFELQFVWSKTADLLKHAATCRRKRNHHIAHWLCAVRHNATVQSSLSFKQKRKHNTWHHRQEHTMYKQGNGMKSLTWCTHYLFLPVILTDPETWIISRLVKMDLMQNWLHIATCICGMKPYNQIEPMIVGYILGLNTAAYLMSLEWFSHWYSCGIWDLHPVMVGLHQKISPEVSEMLLLDAYLSIEFVNLQMIAKEEIQMVGLEQSTLPMSHMTHFSMCQTWIWSQKQWQKGLKIWLKIWLKIKLEINQKIASITHTSWFSVATYSTFEQQLDGNPCIQNLSITKPTNQTQQSHTSCWLCVYLKTN